MKCDGCDSEATVHNLVIVSGKPSEQHLCESCAVKQGLSAGTVPVAAMLLEGVKAQLSAASSERKGVAPNRECPKCGLLYGQFRQQGLLGCPGCYEAFADQLGPLLDRAHDGATQHTGKIPRRFGAHAREGAPDSTGATAPAVDLADLARRQSILQKQLQAAIAAEQFERAACLRDELHKLATLAGVVVPPRQVGTASTPGAPGTPRTSSGPGDAGGPVA